MSTHGCFATPFPPSFFFPVDATRWWILGARCHRQWILLHGGRQRPGVVRRSQVGGLASSIVDVFVLAFLRHLCFNLCLFSDIVASADSCVPSYVFGPSRPLACNIKLVLFWFLSRVVLWYLPVSPWSSSYTFECMISVRLNRGHHKLVSEPTACRNPLSNSLAEVESSLWKTVY